MFFGRAAAITTYFTTMVEVGVIIGAVVASVCALALVSALMYYAYTNYQSQDQKEMQFRLETQRRRESSSPT